MDEDSLQGQLSSIGNLLHNICCSIEDEQHQDTLGKMATDLWELSKFYKLTPEQKLRAKVWDTVAETDIRESDIDSITTDILESMILSHGLLPMQVLEIVLEECLTKQDVSDAIDSLMVG
ncbi:hypothetical protein [Pseudoalteromonas phage J2-1]|uniref:Uncharacterized protein n=1 Tax=Pseudoalteromonas phage J2-1 TaxID=2023998 RepID=A0A223LIJ8_9CAUD|nr:hypothetical protein HOR90_gp39 [Pseudoalteromonas phage J2-1]ASU03326.1 hypothetical protein [Pseudoalteromonas phage J2-1]